MKRVKKNFLIPEDLLDWMQEQEGAMSMTDYITMGIALLARMDFRALQQRAKELGIHEGTLLDVALYLFNRLSADEQLGAVSAYFESIRSSKLSEPSLAKSVPVRRPRK